MSRASPLAEILRWSGASPARPWQVAASMLGVAVPVAVGLAAGQPRAGMAAALGGLALGGEGGAVALREQAAALLRALAAGSAAVLAGSALGGRGLATALALPVLAAAAAVLGGISRPLARASAQFILYAIIAAAVGGRARPLGMALLFALGGAFTAGLALALRPLLRAPWPGAAPAEAAGAAVPPAPTAGQLLRRWRRSLAHLAGWTYALRIGSCLAAAQALEQLVPGHHGYWASVTVAIVVQRNLDAALVRTLQRAAGTTLGVLLTSLLLLGPPPAWATVALVAALAAARPALREASYAAYAAVMTPLVLLLLDLGQAPSWPLVADRLAATLAGCALAVALGWLPWSRLAARHAG